MALLCTICAVFLGLAAWLNFATLEIHAVAQGKIQPNGRSKVVQPAEAGRVTAIRVENGTVVKAGDVLIELDLTEAQADRTALTRDLRSVEAEIEVRKAAISWVQAGNGDAPKRNSLLDAVSTDATREQRVLEAEIVRMVAALDSLAAQRAETIARRQRLEAGIAARGRLLDVLKERVDTRKYLDQNGHGYRARVIDALQEYERENTTLAGEQGQIAEVHATLTTIDRKLAEAAAEFLADQSRRLLEAQRRHDRVSQDLVKAVSRYERTTLRAPIAGVVQQVSVSTIGQVVAAGQALLTIIPTDAAIEIEVLILNKDIGFVEPGQSVVIKVEAFPFTRYGTLTGKLKTISRDAVDARGAATTTDAVAAQQSGTPDLSKGAISHNLVFPATITLDQTTIRVENKAIPLVPGMAVIAEVRTGERRAIDYLLSPLREVAASSAHER